MKRQWLRLVGISLVGTIAALFLAFLGPQFSTERSAPSIGLAQSTDPSVKPPTLPATSPSPALVVPPGIPQIPVVTPSPQPPALPASSAPPLPLQDPTYQDPGGRFRVGVLQGYKVSPLAGSVLIESPDGRLGYTVVAQAQPLNEPIGIRFQSENELDLLSKAAIAVFQRGEGFQPGPPRPEAGGGIVMDWTGTLTIGGRAQPIGGVILVRPNIRSILMTLIAATQAGANQVPGATAAIANSLEAL